MEDFVFLFRRPEPAGPELSPADMQTVFKKWNDWFGGIAAQGKLSNLGVRLSNQGKILKPGGVITDGPFVEIRELLNGFIVIKAENIDDAVTLAHGCPILDVNGTVEIRRFFMSDQLHSHLLSGQNAAKS